MQSLTAALLVMRPVRCVIRVERMDACLAESKMGDILMKIPTVALFAIRPAKPVSEKALGIASLVMT